jgi:hypothetical protein
MARDIKNYAKGFMIFVLDYPCYSVFSVVKFSYVSAHEKEHNLELL